MGCTIGLIRWLMFVFNFLCCLVGLALIALGASTHFKAYSLINELNLEFAHVLSTGMIVVGCVIFIIAFFGCCGAVRESHCMVITFSLCLLTIVVIQVAAGIFIFLNKDKLDESDSYVNTALVRLFKKYKTDAKITFMLDHLQEGLKCCGIQSPDDWRTKFSKAVPLSCCPTDKQSSDSCSEPYSEGCLGAFKNFIRKSSTTIGIAAIVLGVIEIGGIISGLCLANSIRNQERRAYRV